MPVLDTTFLVDLNREPDEHRAFLEDLVQPAGELVVPAQAAIELATGTEDPAEGLRKVHRSFTFVPPDEAISLEAARLAKAAFEEGVFPGWADIQVAATASSLGMAVVTDNASHFEPLGLDVIDYRG